MIKPKLLPQRYKTFSGAAKRASFERSMNPSEYRQGYAKHLFKFRVVQDAEGMFRVERFIDLGESSK